MPLVEKERYQIPRTCKLHPRNDLYRDQEEHKSHVDLNDWQCGYCKKRFYDEKFLDKHFDNRHYNLLNVVSALSFMFLFSFPSSDAYFSNWLGTNSCVRSHFLFLGINYISLHWLGNKGKSMAVGYTECILGLLLLIYFWSGNGHANLHWSKR